MADSNIKISQEAMLILNEEQTKRFRETGVKPTLKDLVEEAVETQFGAE